MIGKKKLRRLAALTKHATISVCVDDIGNIQDINDVCEEAGCQIGLVVEVDVGQERYLHIILYYCANIQKVQQNGASLKHKLSF